MSYNFSKLTTDVAEALRLGTETASNSNDGGSCNLDGVVLRIPRVPEAKIVEALASAGIYTSKGKCGYHGLGYMINPISGGQANKRYVACVAIAKHLKAEGYDVSHYYQLD